MRYGATFPTTEIGSDPDQIRAYAQAVEAMGYDNILVYDHVVGADPDRPGGWANRPYDIDTAFHEPFVLFGYLAALTTRVELATGLIILPQRQTVLVAKQATALDILSGGRVRLGVGLGWNEVEYEALGENFHNRGRRIEEQVAVMRAFWTQSSVDFDGLWHRISRAGINPLPVQRPIPVWFGGSAPAAVERVGRIGDGWIVLGRPDVAAPLIETLHASARAAGRDPSAIGIEGGLSAAGSVDDWVASAKAWTKVGATHLTFSTMRVGYTTTDQHIEALRRFKEAVN